MRYMIEVRYSYGWDNAGWTEDNGNGPKPMRFQTIDEARKALDEFFSDVKAAVIQRNMDAEESRGDYRVVEATD